MKYIKILIVLIVSVLATSCFNSHHGEHEGHNHASNEETVVETDEHGHDENSVELSEKQIETVGIAYGFIKEKDLTSKIRANGFLRVPSNSMAKISSLYDGIIKKFYVQVGDKVKKGQTLAVLVNPEIIDIQRDYLNCKNELKQAKSNLERQKVLVKSKASSKKVFEETKTKYESLKIQEISLKATLELIGFDVRKLNYNNLHSKFYLKSPINGIISNINTCLGDYANKSQAIINVVDNSSLHLDLHIFEKDLTTIKIGQKIHFTLTNNPTKEYDASVYAIDSSFEDESKSIAVHCKVLGDKTGLINGMNITGIISLGKSVKPAVPNESIVQADGKFYIFMKFAEEKDENAVIFKRVAVLKGTSDMGYTSITLLEDFDLKTPIVTKGAFFVNAKMNNTGEHSHSH